MDSLADLIAREQVDDDFDLLKALADGNWKARVSEALQLLQDLKQHSLWDRAIAVCFWAVSRGTELPMPRMEVVARLYWCLENVPDGTGMDYVENLVWTIATELKGVGYHSNWEPQTDPLVLTYLAPMRELIP